MAISTNQVSSLLELLPAVFQSDRKPDGVGSTGKLLPDFLGRFLLPFEELLLGLGPDQDADLPAGIEETIATISRYFEPTAQPGGTGAPDPNTSVPSDFLPWLAGWVALTLREDWDQDRKRELIAKAAQLYQRRGTTNGIKDFLTLYTRRLSTIDEYEATFRVGVRSTVGVDTYLGEGSPFFFHVYVTLPIASLENMRLTRAIATAIIDLQKPAHTYYQLTIATPTFQIGVHSTVGEDTLLG